jgi:hypothetical protein
VKADLRPECNTPWQIKPSKMYTKEMMKEIKQAAESGLSSEV